MFSVENLRFRQFKEIPGSIFRGIQDLFRSKADVCTRNTGNNSGSLTVTYPLLERYSLSREIKTTNIRNRDGKRFHLLPVIDLSQTSEGFQSDELDLGKLVKDLRQLEELGKQSRGKRVRSSYSRH